MPIPVETLRRMDRMNVIFAVSAALLLVTTIWFVVVDHNRPWRSFQDDFMSVQAALAHLDYLQTLRADAQAQFDAAAERVESARLAVESRQAEIDRLQATLAELKGRHDDIKLRFGDADGELQVLQQQFEKTLAKYGPDDPHTLEMRQTVDAASARANALKRDKEQIEDAQRETEDRIKEIREPLVDAQKAFDALAQTRAAAREKAEDYSSPARHTIFNLALFDFLAPFNTPGRQEVKQLVLPEVRQNLNYLETYTTDRCVTCHVAIDNPELTREALTRTMERAIPAIDEELQRLGRPALEPIPLPQIADSGEDAPKLEAGNVTRDWPKLTRAQQDAYMKALLERVNAYLADQGFDRIELAQPLLGHPDLDLFVQVDSPHPMQKMGCTVCHEGNPQETDFVLAAHSPPDHETESEWKEKYYVTALGVPNATFEWMEHFWDRHMLPLKYTEGSCMKCHQNPTGIGEFAGEQQAREIQHGRMLFSRAGCANCHLVDTDGLKDFRRVGPDLSHVATKLQPGFAQQWIYNPRQFRPSTWMPHFFMQENNGAGSENDFDPDPDGRNRAEVAAMTHYLFSLSTDWQSEPLPQGLTANAENGRALFATVGCLGCHASLSEFGETWIRADLEHKGKTPAQAQADYDAMTYNQRVQYAVENFVSDRDTIFSPDEVRFDPEKPYNEPIFTRIGPELSAMGTKTTVEWLYAWLRDPIKYSSDTRMPSLRLTEQEALDIAAYLVSLKHDQPNVAPFPDDDAQHRMVETLAFDLLAAQRSAARSRAILNDEGDELTRMITTTLAQSSVADIAEERVAAMSLYEKQLMFLGSKSISHYGCYACHNIPGFETAVRPGTELTVWAQKPISQLDFGFFDPAYDTLREKKEKQAIYATLYPPHRPDLIEIARGHNPPEEITHTHAAFAYHKLLNPRIWDRERIRKPLDKLKMPNFYFTEDEANALVTYLMGRTSPRVRDSLVVDYDDPRRAVAEGRNLVRDLNCVGCHQIEDNVPTVQQFFRTVSAGRPRFDEDNAPPYLRGEGAKIQHKWFYEFLYNVEMLRPWLKIRMPSFTLKHDEVTTIVEYFAGLSQEESTRLARHLRPVDDFIATVSPGVPVEGTNGSELPPGHDWFMKETLEPAKDFLGRYAVNNRLVREFQLDPSENAPDELAEVYHAILADASFLRDLYAIRYPFVDAPRPPITDERFKLGEEFLLNLGCLKCHVLGDPSVEGANTAPTAPNLNLAYRRLQQNWIRNWVKRPAVIQPGTKMPGLWPDGGNASAFLDYGDSRAEMEARFGASAEEQISLVLDYLYHAGLRNHTAIDPKVAAAQKAPPPSEGEEFIEEEEEFFEEEE